MTQKVRRFASDRRVSEDIRDFTVPMFNQGVSVKSMTRVA